LKKLKIYLLLLFLLFSLGCSKKTIYQIDGAPVPDNVIKAKTFDLNLVIKYNLTRFFEVKEGDESYMSYEFLPLLTPKIHKIKNSDRLVLNINVFNPSKNYYKLIKYIKLEGGDAAAEILYEGDLSRKNITVELPLVTNKLISFYYDACDKSEQLIFRSFKAQYITER